ncbi:MAG: methylated-DNA--[protein]-cysteine S-methyltransferase [Buchananella hordeovulneris]|nr:methylated-DNA--[protein]-cysteine S-methyltransferase [Buchananella hordeovulneris]
MGTDLPSSLVAGRLDSPLGTILLAATDAGLWEVVLPGLSPSALLARALPALDVARLDVRHLAAQDLAEAGPADPSTALSSPASFAADAPRPAPLDVPPSLPADAAHAVPLGAPPSLPTGAPHPTPPAAQPTAHSPAQPAGQSPAQRHLRRAAAELAAYLAGGRAGFTVPLDLRTAGFSRRAQLALAQISSGQTESYGQLAARLGSPRAARAVGRACATNPLPLVLPCHRVLASAGLGGYAGGLEQKRWLLRLEGAATG